MKTPSTLEHAKALGCVLIPGRKHPERVNDATRLTRKHQSKDAAWLATAPRPSTAVGERLPTAAQDAPLFSAPNLRRTQALRELATVVVILCVAGFLRLWNLDSASFTYDAALIGNMAADLITTGRPLLQGMVSSVGVQNPALAIYLFSLPVALQGDPKTIIAFIALLNTAAVGGVYWLGRRYWSATVGCLAALLFGVSAWAVHYGRQVWPPSLIPPANVLLLAVLLAWVVKRSRWALSAAIVTQAALIQLNFSAAALAPMVAILLVVELLDAHRNRQPGRFWRPAAIGSGISLLMYTPYLWAEAQNGWPNIRRLTELLRVSSRFHPQAFDLASMMIGGRNIHALAGAQRFREFFANLVDPTYLLDRVAEGLVVMAILYLIVHVWRERREGSSFRRDGLLLLWLASVMFFFLRSSTDVHPHYFVSLYPVPFFVLAVAAGDVVERIAVYRRLKRVIQPLSFLLLGVFVIWQGYLSMSIYRFLEIHDTPDGWGTPISILSAVAANIERSANRFHSSEVLLLCSGAEPRWDECPATFRYLTRRSPRAVSFMDRNDRNIWTHAADAETLVVLAPGAGLAAAELPQFASPLPEATVPLRENVDAYRFFRIHNYYQEIAAQLQEALPAAGAIVLIGRNQETELRRFYRGNLPVYELPESGQSVAEATAQLAQLAARHPRFFVLFRVSEDVDPTGMLDAWLGANTYQLADVWLGTVRFVETQLPGSDAQYWPTWHLNADLGDRLYLRSHSLSSMAIRGGEPLLIQLLWDATRAPDIDYAAFVQLWDDQAHVIAQRDIRLLPRDHVSDARRVGNLTESRIGLVVPAATRSGAYRLIAGAYDPRTGQRLPVAGSDHVELGTIQVENSD